LRELLPGWNHPPQENGGKWTHDGRYYLFLSTRDSIRDIWVLLEQSSIWRKTSAEPVQLTTGPLQFSELLPSRDGKKLFAAGSQSRGKLVRYDATSGEYIPFLNGISAGDLDFSRDGKWVSYVVYPEGTLWRSRLDGTDRMQLTFAPMQVSLVHWSPNGQKIAFSGMSAGKPWEIFMVSANGGGLQQLTPSDELETDPAWSSDGNTLAFGANGPNSEKVVVKLLDLATRKISVLEGMTGVFAPRWSPDGRFIAALTSDSSGLMLGQPVNFCKHSRGTMPRAICCATGTAFMVRSFVRQRNGWVFGKS
jgi:Tol biopolymer transport system component